VRSLPLPVPSPARAGEGCRSGGGPRYPGLSPWATLFRPKRGCAGTSTKYRKSANEVLTQDTSPAFADDYALDAQPFLMFFLYSLLFTLGVVLAVPYYIWRYRKTSLLRSSWRERLGYLQPEYRQERTGAIWIHAVSVGETLAIVGLVRALQERYPKRKVFLSHATPTGRETGEKRLPRVAGRFYLPLDWGVCTRRALDCLKPGVLIVVETELWPNLLRMAHRSGVRVVLVNARISDQSFPGYRFFRPFMRRVLENVDSILAQTARDADRLRAIGAASDRVIVAGNLKFDGQPPETTSLTTFLKNALTAADRHPIMVAASTMAGEEELVLRAWREIHRRYPHSLLILAPRHPARFERVGQLLASQGVSFVPRTVLSEHSDAAVLVASPAVLLLDTLGELVGILELADVVFVGGSLVPAGGHNLLEPAQWGKPVIFGPHMENFRDAADTFLEAGAAIRVQTWSELSTQTVFLFEDDKQRIAMGTAARETVEQGRGATDRILNGISQLIDNQEG
jgi:3-deoxy-D-manno-octulosonic-acid transferase